ncbi:DUF4097 family beta strand repeat-containing protein [Microbacterium rhizophilus]|uniref:DUF4097 family beta strand repeat-containing protein n=1 Tax=Microbacterium rhizophilus TaxID=3138934 RepID=UPI0031EED98C
MNTDTTTAALTLDIAWGSVLVRAVERDDIDVQVAPSNPDRRGDREMAARTQVDRAGSGVSVVSAARWAAIGANGSIDVTIEVPVRTPVTAKVHGSFIADGRLGDVRFSGSATGIQFSDVGDLYLKTDAGVRVGRVRGTADVRISSGSLRVDRIDGDARVKNASGDIAVGTLGGVSDLHTASGSIEIGSAHADLVARTAYGSLHVAEIAGERAELHSSYGAITAGVPAGTAVWLDALSKHGTVRSSLAASGAPGAEDPKLELRAHSGYGDIVIRYATT